jgi:predicted nucleic acid-binding Zn ribbon protein
LHVALDHGKGVITSMKRCPFCAEEIQDAAVKCKHCGEFLDSAKATARTEPQLKWYFKGVYLVIILGCIGPLGLPLIWWHPTMHRYWKIGLTLAICVLTWLTVIATVESLKVLKESYSDVQQMLDL